MRRTEQEFKAELHRRAEKYQAARRRRRKKLLTAALCFVVVFAGWSVASAMKIGADNAASSMEIMADTPMEMITGNSAVNDKSEPECAPGAAVEEGASPEEGKGHEPLDAEYGGSSSESKRYDILYVEIVSFEEELKNSITVTDAEQIASIMNAIEGFIPQYDETAIPDWNGIVYQIIVTRERQTDRYTLAGNYLSSETEGWVCMDADAAKILLEAITN